MSEKLTTKQVKKVLGQAYNRENYLNFLTHKFNFSQFIKAVSINKSDDVKSFEQLGFITTADDKELPIFEIHVKPNTKLARNRVQLRNLVAKQIQTQDGAIAVYVDDENQQWRFSFIAIEYKQGDDGIEQEKTASKRFTYFLGKGAKVGTPTRRFDQLNQSSTLADLKTAFAVESLNKEFYDKLYTWYKKAQTQVQFPHDEHAKKHIQTNLIRFLTRILFVWFLKEKKLINQDLFDLKKLKTLIDYEQDSSFYKAILQNLFFATLSTKIIDRKFRSKDKGHKGYNRDFGNQYVFRYQKLFQKQDVIQDLFNATPFLNGGLFECLDDKKNKIYIDGFSNTKKRQPIFPNELLFNDEQDLGLIDLFNQYQFTVEESTPTDIEVALDPELLGKIFENLLATYNPETKQQTRKATGSFYTPREIVGYMVDESLWQHFKTHTDLDEVKINDLFIEKENSLNNTEIKTVINAIDSLKILDPAVGSGAYPMGVLQRLVFILDKIDHKNHYFKQQQLDKTKTMEEASKKASVAAIEQIFSTKNQHNTYGKKLMLIESCIYGVDIQPIAIQICKLRFFISLTIEQQPNNNKNDNYGIKALPNLETKFIVANTLLPLGEKPQQTGLFDTDIENLKINLAEVRHQYFSAKTLKTKRKYRDEDKKIRNDMLETLKQSGITPEVEQSMKKVVNWDLYNHNSTSDWFDPEWMFGVKEGFDIVIGNPPYISALEAKKSIDAKTREQYKKIFVSSTGAYDIYVLFFELGMVIIKNSGSLNLITPSKFLSASYAKSLREFILKYSLLKISDFSSIRIFESASVSAISTFICKIKVSQDVVVDKYHSLKDLNNVEHIVSKREYLNFFTENIWGFLLSDNIKILLKIVNNSNTLADIANVNASSTASEAGKYSNYVYRDECSNCMKIINTGTIGSINNFWGVKEIKNKSEKILTPFLDLTNVNKRRELMYKTPKLIFKKLSKNIMATYDMKGEFASTNTNFVYNPNSQYLLSFLALHLNSKLMNFIYKQLFGGLSMLGSFQFQAPQLRILPIPKISITDQQPFIKLVDKIISAKQHGKDSTALESQIDNMVYQLYDLTADEIKIIENKD